MTLNRLFIDAHVHFHSVFQPHRFLNAACENFQRCFPCHPDESWIGVLLLADTDSQDTIKLLKDSSIDGWTLQPTQDECAWLAVRDGCAKLVLVAGRQIETAERLEVMALATNDSFREGRSINETLQRVCSSGAIPVIPWGFGKWSFERGSIVGKLVRSLSAGELALDCEVFLGDNGGRARMLGAPRLFALAADLGVRILPGSDPLPLTWHVEKAGSYGFSLPASCDERRPATQLKELLETDRSQPPTHGDLQPAGVFVRNQLAMQLRKIGA